MKIKVGVVGGSGYTGGELLRLLLFHPNVELHFVVSRSYTGQQLSKVHPDLLGSQAFEFCEAPIAGADVWFLCLPHGQSGAFLETYAPLISEELKIIDLSNSFRLSSDAKFGEREFIYGATEIHRAKIQKANSIANPGCFATAINLALAPLFHKELVALDQEVHINAVTGSTGAGIKPSATAHFSYRNNNFSWYKPFSHQHLDEIAETVYNKAQASKENLHFLPHRGDFTRGIFATAYTKIDCAFDEVLSAYEAFYEQAPFTHVCPDELQLKQVVNSNNCHIHLMQHQDKILITSVLDNLLKGASGQAVENMNLIFGLNQQTGLQLKTSIF